MENIVIIDHQSDRRLAESYSNILLETYNELGSDVWQCDGSFHYKKEMWTAIIHEYTKSTGFVFPLDVDEFLTVKVKKDPLNLRVNDTKEDKYEETEQLSWNAKDFTNALNKLPDSEKPFKMEAGLALPTDCGDIMWDANDYSLNAGAIHIDNTANETDVDSLRESGRLKFVGRRRTRQSMCHDKSFFRAKDFYKTDTGNHQGETHRYKGTWEKNCKKVAVPTYIPRKGWRNETNNQHDPDQSSDLYLLHLQQVNFGEWLIHALRGAAGRSFNRFTDLVDCTKTVESVHYCTGWKKLYDAGFDPNEMKKTYRRDVCSLVVNGHFPFPVGHLF